MLDAKDITYQLDTRERDKKELLLTAEQP